MRAGYCPQLNSYLSMIRNNVDNRCPNCDVAAHDIHHIFNCSKNTTDLKLIDLWGRRVEVTKWLDLIPSVLHDRTARNNPPSFSLILTMPLLVPLTRGTHVIHRGVDAERSPHHKQVVVRQSHITTNIPIIMIQMQSRVPVKNGNKCLYSAKFTRELLLCATASTTTTTKPKARRLFESNSPDLSRLFY